MKIQKYTNFKLPEHLDIELQNDNEDTFIKVCSINKTKPLFIEIPECTVKTFDNGSCVIKQDTILKNVVDNIEKLCIKNLHLKSKEIFGKELDESKFIESIISNITKETINLNVDANTKCFDSTGSEIDIFNSENAVKANIIIHIKEISFYKNKFYVDFYLKFLREIEVASDTEDTKQNKEQAIEVEEDESQNEEKDNFF